MPPKSRGDNRVKENEIDHQWKSRYGEVVWARFGSLPWWPAYIIDPNDLVKRHHVCRAKGLKAIGKEYTIYFYGDGTTAVLPPSRIDTWNRENCNQYLDQNVPKRYLESFALAYNNANDDSKRSKPERIPWYRREKTKEEAEEPLTQRDRIKPKKRLREQGNPEPTFLKKVQTPEKKLKGNFEMLRRRKDFVSFSDSEKESSDSDADYNNRPDLPKMKKAKYPHLSCKVSPNQLPVDLGILPLLSLLPNQVVKTIISSLK